MKGEKRSALPLGQMLAANIGDTMSDAGQSYFPQQEATEKT